MTPPSSRLTAVAVAAIALLMATSCTRARDQEAAPPNDPARIVVGSFDFTESRILAAVYSAALQAHGFEVELLSNVGSREVMEPALEQAKVDLLPEYGGTGFGFIARGSPGASTAAATHRKLRRAFARRGIAVLDFAPAENKNEIVVTQRTARRYDLDTISDLGPVAARLVFGGPPECPARPFCLIGLGTTYGLEFKAFQPLDVGGPATVAALEGDEIDVGLMFTTDPNIDTRSFVVLRDDRRLQPAENVVPVVREEIVDYHGPKLVRVVNAVSHTITTRDLRALNGLVDVEGESPSQVADRFLAVKGLLP